MALLACAILVALLALHAQPSAALRLAVLPGPAEIQSTFNLERAAAALTQRGHTVSISRERIIEDSVVPPTSLLPGTDQGVVFDAVIAQGQPAIDIADLADKLDVPIVRFLEDREEVDVLHERPAVLVFASAPAAAAIGDLIEEAPRIICSPHTVSDADSQMYGELEERVEELARAKATLLEAGTFWDRVAKSKVEDGGDVEDESGAACAARHNADPPYLGVAMIVKNEAGTIGQTLEGVRGAVDYVTVVDTGSTDGTQEAVKSALAGTPHQLLEHPFEDFATTRNWALQAHGNKTAYCLMIDADFVVEGMWHGRAAARRLVHECRGRSLPLCAKGIKIWLTLGQLSFFSNRMFPGDGLGTPAGWKYTYPVHEVPSRDELAYLNVYTVEDSVKYGRVRMRNIPITHNKSPTRWRNLDLPLLTKEHEKRPNDTRVIFYLAQTLDLIGELEPALAMYQKRIDAGGWLQEVFEAHMRRGRILHENLKERDPVPDFLAASAISPARAEPLIWLCWHYHGLLERCGVDDRVCHLQNRVAAYYYAKAAAELPYPSGEALFIHDSVYDYQAKEALSIHAWYVAKELGDAFGAGREAAAAVLATKAEPHRLRNLELYGGLPQAADAREAAEARLCCAAADAARQVERTRDVPDEGAARREARPWYAFGR
ncbi:hypothetical protein WJX81_004467 [Elliptochloris bilobata]|uniref:Glycosyltransferase 2-like domain-containing protein n=1 Tax=Elliptochloris bilobata TaxID=381761 RepID=A0AAW1R1E2_9CHLO